MIFLDYIKLLIFSIVAEKVGNDFFKKRQYLICISSICNSFPPT